MAETKVYTLTELSRLVARQLSVPQLQETWVVAELSDLNDRSGHCYMELIDKNADTGAVNAKMRGVIWASTYARILPQFVAATGQRLASGLKVMVKGSVNYHSAYGLSFVITGINPDYTLGEAERRRREILSRLQREGLLDMNKELGWPATVQRIAVISARGAAGYGDFMNQLYHNASRLRFEVKLFEAVMQGERTVDTVIAALERINRDIDRWDCVVIIRGGGATSELASFDDYRLAVNVAQFPLPVVVGIGHERDVTVLDYVASKRVKTPTAAAEWLIAEGEKNLEMLKQIAINIHRLSVARLSGSKEHLAYLSSKLPATASLQIERQGNKLKQYGMALSNISSRCIQPERQRLDHTWDRIATSAQNIISRQSERLTAREQLIKALSPQSVLNRGYSITRIDGKALRSKADAKSGATIVTTLAEGTIESIIK